jgi:hypothetical protein
VSHVTLLYLWKNRKMVTPTPVGPGLVPLPYAPEFSVIIAFSVAGFFAQLVIQFLCKACYSSSHCLLNVQRQASRYFTIGWSPYT